MEIRARIIRICDPDLLHVLDQKSSDELITWCKVHKISHIPPGTLPKKCRENFYYIVQLINRLAEEGHDEETWEQLKYALQQSG